MRIPRHGTTKGLVTLSILKIIKKLKFEQLSDSQTDFEITKKVIAKF